MRVRACVCARACVRANVHPGAHVSLNVACLKTSTEMHQDDEVLVPRHFPMRIHTSFSNKCVVAWHP